MHCFMGFPIAMQALDVEKWLPSVLHEAYFCWHSSLHTGVLTMPLPALAGTSSKGRSAETQQLTRPRQSGLSNLHSAPRGLLASTLVMGPEAATPVGVWPARLLQLKLATRHLGRCDAFHFIACWLQDDVACSSSSVM